jgi:hypothetical protein
MGSFGGFKVYPPASQETIRKAERQLGFPLPALLKELYREVGNGGFGPGYGIFGVYGGAPAIDSSGEQHDLVSFYQLHTGNQAHSVLEHDFSSRGSLFLQDLSTWFDKLVPICDWGCHHTSLLDCSKEAAPVIHHVGYGGELIFESASLEGWLMDWLQGVDLFGRVNPG